MSKNDLFEQAIELHQQGNLTLAEERYRAVIELDPTQANALYLLGKLKAKQGFHEEAVQYFRRATALSAHNADFILGLANSLAEAGFFELAAREYKRLLSLRPESAEVYVRLGDLFHRIGNDDLSRRSYQMALRFDHDNFQAYANLGNLLRAGGRYTEALCCYRESLRLRPDFPKTLNNYAQCLTDVGRIDEAEKVYRQALALKPDFAEVHSNLLFCLCYRHDYSVRALFKEHQRYGKQHGVDTARRYGEYGCEARPDKRLCIGFVSPDFRGHSVTYFLEPILKNLDRDRFEIACYAQVELEDTITQRLRKYADVWCDTCRLTDEALAERIHRDAVDILIDLAGHTGGNRLGAFAFKPAPVQCTYLGYPNTTGLETVDYRLTDSTADPHGQDKYYTERLVRLTRCFLCYMPPSDAPPAGPLPAGSSDHVVFGSFNTLQKLNERVLKCWSAILRAVPLSRMLLKRRGLDDADTRVRIVSAFRDNGVDPLRLELVGHVDATIRHLDYYNKVDICLDPFPYNGTTTTCEALWMGVPVVALCGKHHAGRVSTSILNTLGLEDLVAATEEDYIEKAIRLARDRARLGTVRSSLRGRMEQGGMCNGQAFTRDFEQALRRMWNEWCDGGTAAPNG